MNFEPDFRAPNSNDSVVAAAVVALVLVGLICAVFEVFGVTTRTYAASPAAGTAAENRPCLSRSTEEAPEACVKRGPVEEREAATH